MISHRKEIWDTVYLVALQGFNYIAPLIVFPYLMIVLGADKFGYVGFSLAIIQYLTLIVDFGFNLSATKRIALALGDERKLMEIFYSTQFAKLILLFVSLIFLIVIAFCVPRFAVYSTTMLVLFLLVIGNTFSFVWFFQGIGKIRIISIVNIFSKILILPLTFVFVKHPSDVNIAAAIQSVVYILSSAITVYIIVKNKYIKKWFWVSISQIMTEIKASFPIFLSSAATSIYTALFVIILGYFSTPSEVGKYTAVEKIMRAFTYLIFVPLSQSFYPKISALAKDSKKDAINLVLKLTYFVGFTMMFVFAIMFFFSDLLVRFLGKDYKETILLFKIMAFIPFFISLGGVFGQLGLLAIGNEKEKKIFQKVYIIAGIVALILIFLLVPEYYSVGASISLLLTEFSVFIMMFIYSFRLMNSKRI